MSALDDNMLFVVRTMKKQTNSQKLKELGTPDEWHNYAVIDDLLLLISTSADSEAIKCEYVISLNDIFSISRHDGFLAILYKDCSVHVLEYNTHTLWVWLPKDEDTLMRVFKRVHLSWEFNLSRLPGRLKNLISHLLGRVQKEGD